MVLFMLKAFSFCKYTLIPQHNFKPLSNSLLYKKGEEKDFKFYSQLYEVLRALTMAQISFLIRLVKVKEYQAGY